MHYVTNSPSSRLPKNRAIKLAKTLFSWWKDEVQILWPRKCRFPKTKYCIAYWDQKTLRFAICKDGQVEDLGKLSFEQGTFTEAHPTMLRKVRSCRIPIVLRISNAQGIEVTDRLPQTATKELDKILVHRLDKICPWNHDSIQYAVTDVANVAGEHVDVRLSIVPQNTVLTARCALKSLSLDSDTIDLEGDDWTAPPNHDLGSLSNRPRISRKAIAVLVTLQVSFTAVAVIAGVDLTARTEVKDARLKQLALLEKNLIEQRALHSRLVGHERDRDALQTIQDHRVAALVVLENLTRVLPDQTWLDNLTITQSQIAISGYSSDAPALPALLESVSTFDSVTFTAPIERSVTSMAHEGGFIAERFALRMQTKASLSLISTPDLGAR